MRVQIEQPDARAIQARPSMFRAATGIASKKEMKGRESGFDLHAGWQRACSDNAAAL